MNLKHVALIAAGAYVGHNFITPMLPTDLPFNLGLYGGIALGVVLIEKVL
jgi:hypothetical protein